MELRKKKKHWGEGMRAHFRVAPEMFWERSCVRLLGTRWETFSASSSHRAILGTVSLKRTRMELRGAARRFKLGAFSVWYGTSVVVEFKRIRYLKHQTRTRVWYSSQH